MLCVRVRALLGCGKGLSMVGDEAGEVWLEGEEWKGLEIGGRHVFVACRQREEKWTCEKSVERGDGCHGGNVLWVMVKDKNPTCLARRC